MKVKVEEKKSKCKSLLHKNEEMKWNETRKGSRSPQSKAKRGVKHKFHLNIVEPFFEFDFISMVLELSPASDAKIWAPDEHEKYCKFHFRFQFLVEIFSHDEVEKSHKGSNCKRNGKKNYVKTIKIEDN